MIIRSAVIFLALSLMEAGSPLADPGAAVAATWRDPSVHTRQFVGVTRNVQLEVLDWGGSGKAIVLLAGSGYTAHVYDDFAPKLTSRYHVYGITRRGFGASGFDLAEYGTDRLGDDVLAVINTLKLNKPILVGHSFAGAELSDVATRYPNRISGLVYLEAAYTYAFKNDQAPTMAEFQQVVRGPQTPPADSADLVSFGALQKYRERMTGVRLPEAELRQQWEATPDQRVGKRRVFPGGATLMDGTKEFPHIRVPALVIFANPHGLGPWLDDNPDPSVQTAVRAYSSAFEAFTRRQTAAVADGMPAARIVTLPGAKHAIFISNETDVLREIADFLASLR